MIHLQAEGYAEELLKIATDELAGEMLRYALLKEAGLFRRMGDVVSGAAQRVGQRARSFNAARKQHAADWSDQYAGLQRERAKKNQMFEENVAEGIAGAANKVLGATKSKQRLMTPRGQKAYDRMMERERRWEKTKRLRAQAMEKDLPIPHRGQTAKPAVTPTPAQQYAENIAESKRRMDIDASRKMEELGVGGAVRGLMKKLTPSDPVAHKRRMEQLVGQRFATAGGIPGT